MKNKSPLLSFALTLATAARDEILPRFQSTTVDAKADGSEVTEADRYAEAMMCALIREKYPSHGILGEEEGKTNGIENYQWVLDPIDGTTWFVLGIPRFGTLVALLEGRKPRLGVIHLPVTAETLYAECGKGCWYTRKGREPERVRVDSGTMALETAFVSVSGIDNSDICPGDQTKQYRLSQLIRQANRVEFVGDCIQHMLVARGYLHAALDTVMYPWDSAAIVPCIQEAGGIVSTMDGYKDDVVFGGSLLTCCSPPLHETILSLPNTL
jgi:histidinol-phosphatase